MKLKPSIYQPPSDVWYYSIPELKGVVVTGHNLESLIHEAFLMYWKNQIQEPSDLATRIENAVCERLDESWCTGGAPGTRLTMRNVYSFGKAVLRRLKIGKHNMLVSQAEAERRAAICAECTDYNLNIHGCSVCMINEMSMAGLGIDEQRRTAHHSKLFACGVCKCPCMTIVHLKQQEIDAVHKGEHLVYPAHCWQRKSNETP
jgi:hypothetical protein